MLRNLLEAADNWRLTPDDWQRAARAVEDLASALTTPDLRDLDDIVEQFEAIVPGARAPVMSMDDPRLTAAPRRIEPRINEVIPLITDVITRIDRDGQSGRTRPSGADVR
ncbi:CATRA system-associated protein [Micromonospora sonneratiae]